MRAELDFGRRGPSTNFHAAPGSRRRRLLPGIEEPLGDLLARNGDDELILEADAGTNSHRRTRSVAVRKEFLQEAACFACHLTRDGMLGELRQSRREVGGFRETKQPQNVEPIFVLSSRGVVLALFNFV